MTTPTPAVRGLYAYAITTDRGLDLGGVPAVDGATPRVIGHDGIGLVVSDVALSTLDAVGDDVPGGDGAGGDELAEDGRLAELARTHDAVIRAVAAQAPVLPLRFGTVVTDPDAAVRLLRHRHRYAERLLGHVAGHREWGVRLRLATPESTPDTPPAAPDEPAQGPVRGPAPEPASSGTAYLARRRQARDQREAAVRRRRELLDAAHTGLSGYARDAVLRTARSTATVSDAAYLVAPEAEPGFFAEAERLAGLLGAEGITLECTGPWPPYSFVREATDD